MSLLVQEEYIYLPAPEPILEVSEEEEEYEPQHPMLEQYDFVNSGDLASMKAWVGGKITGMKSIIKKKMECDDDCKWKNLIKGLSKGKNSTLYKASPLVRAIYSGNIRNMSGNERKSIISFSGFGWIKRRNIFDDWLLKNVKLGQKPKDVKLKSLVSTMVALPDGTGAQIRSRLKQDAGIG